jgi:hypothetical protein
VERQLFIPCRQFELPSVTGLWLIWKNLLLFWILDFRRSSETKQYV